MNQKKDVGALLGYDEDGYPIRERGYEHGCKCHGELFCPDYEFAGYSDDVPIFVRKKPVPETKAMEPPHE